MSKISNCAKDCGKLIKSTPVLVAVYCAEYDYTDKELFTCGWCSNNETWTISEMLWSVKDEYFVTACCHTEAIAALIPENLKDEYDQNREDYENYVWAVTGR